jgi:hypothetical protein
LLYLYHNGSIGEPGRRRGDRPRRAREIHNRRLWKQAALSIGTLLGKLEGGFIYQTVLFGIIFLDSEDVRSLKGPGLP